MSSKKICILGFAFKANTNDTRESAAITICKDLLAEGALLYINDPKVTCEQIAFNLEKNANNSIKEIDNNSTSNFESEWCFVENIIPFFKDADAAIILTEWEDYAKMDWKFISKEMRKPAWIFDSRSLLKNNLEIDPNVNLWRIGDGSSK